MHEPLQQFEPNTQLSFASRQPHAPSAQTPAQQSPSKTQNWSSARQPHAPAFGHVPLQQSVPNRQSSPSARQPHLPLAQTPEQHSPPWKQFPPSGVQLPPPP
jgi:hypothetical protein